VTNGCPLGGLRCFLHDGTANLLSAEDAGLSMKSAYTNSSRRTLPDELYEALLERARLNGKSIAGPTLRQHLRL
jgi:hypothetical protein